MKKYYVNSVMLGSDATEEDAMRMVEILHEMGYDNVEYTSDTGYINDPDYDDEDYIPSEDIWESALNRLIEQLKR